MDLCTNKKFLFRKLFVRNGFDWSIHEFSEKRTHTAKKYFRNFYCQYFIHSENMDNEERSMFGNYAKQIQNIEDITFADFSNPWNFFKVISQDDEGFYRWLVKEGFLAENILCDKCEGYTVMIVNNRKGKKPFAKSFRCTKNRSHERSITVYSFFESVKINPRDVFVFLRSYLKKESLKTCALEAGINYKSTAVDWGNFIREIFAERVVKDLNAVKFHGCIELDESLFGKKCNRKNSL